MLALVRELLPLRAESEASLLGLAATVRCWVAEDHGVIGFGRVRGRRLWLGVRPSARGRGAGSALWARVGEQAEEPAVCWADTDAGIRVRGGARIPAHCNEDRVEARCRVNRATAADAPRRRGAHPLVGPGLPARRAGGRRAGRPVSYALLTTDERGVAENEFTAALPGYRGRGLATLCKLETVRWAKAHGIHTIVTGNDSENAAMLAINRKLGYSPTTAAPNSPAARTSG